VGNFSIRFGGAAETQDLFVLGGQPCQGLGAEVGELVDRGVCLREQGFELVDIGPKPVDLRCLRVGGVPIALGLPKPLLEFDAQVCVGPVAVEGGAVDALLTELKRKSPHVNRDIAVLGVTVSACDRRW
jgi:hypothetical protein